METSSAKTSPQAKTTSSPDTTKSSKAKSHVPSKAEEGVGSGKGTGKEGGRSSGQAKKAKVVSSKVRKDMLLGDRDRGRGGTFGFGTVRSTALKCTVPEREKAFLYMGRRFNPRSKNEGFVV